MNFLCILLKVTAIFLSWTNTEIRSQWLSYCLKWRSRRLDSLSSGTYMYKTCLVYRDVNHGSITHCCFMFISFFSFSQFCSVRGFSLNHTLSISSFFFRYLGHGIYIIHWRCSFPHRNTKEFVMIKDHNCVAFMLIIFIRDQIESSEWFTML